MAMGGMIARSRDLTLKRCKQIIHHPCLFQMLAKGPDRVPIRKPCLPSPESAHSSTDP